MIVYIKLIYYNYVAFFVYRDSIEAYEKMLSCCNVIILDSYYLITWVLLVYGSYILTILFQI